MSEDCHAADGYSGGFEELGRIKIYKGKSKEKQDIVHQIELRCRYILGACADLSEAQAEARHILKLLGVSDAQTKT